MKKSCLPLLLIVVGLVGGQLVGCQSAPRFAWWKSDSAASENSSLVARSAPTVAPSVSQTAGLPSNNAQPQTMAARTAPAQTVPSAALVAGTPQIPAMSVPSGSSGTLSSAPVANYQAAAPPSAAASNYTVPASTTAVAATTPTTNSVGTTVPVTSGPYDPARYQSQAAAVASTVPAAAPVADRYASAPATGVPAVAPVANRYGNSGAGRYGSSPATVLPSVAAPSADRYSSIPSATPVPSVPTAVAAPSVNPLREQITASTTAVNGAAQNGVAQATAGTVNLVSTAGQYRPGGTSTYPNSQINIATRPNSTIGAPTTGAPTTTTPATGSRY